MCIGEKLESKDSSCAWGCPTGGRCVMSPGQILPSLEAGTISLQVYLLICLSSTQIGTIGTLLFKYSQPLFSGSILSEVCSPL